MSWRLFPRVAPLVLLLLTAGACAGGPVITRVDQAALFRPNLVHFGAAGDRLLLEMHGAPLPAGTSRTQLAEAMTLPAKYRPIRFELVDDSGDGSRSAAGDIRMVLVVNPAAVPLAETVCRRPADIVAAPGGQLNIMAVLCAGSRYAAKGNVKIGDGDGTARHIAAGLRGLFSDMLRPPLDSSGNIFLAAIAQQRRAGGACRIVQTAGLGRFPTGFSEIC